MVFVIGKLPTGVKNSITDVEGVSVGHKTLRGRDINTGVTALIPHEGNIFREKAHGCCPCCKRIR